MPCFNASLVSLPCCFVAAISLTTGTQSPAIRERLPTRCTSNATSMRSMRARAFRKPWRCATGGIAYVGLQRRCQGAAGSATRVVDVQQHLLMPGLVDGHMPPARRRHVLLRNANL